MTLLLVDDHHLFRDAVAMLIGHRLPQLRTEHAATLAEAEARAAGLRDLRLVLLDLSLPDSDGVTGVARMRAAAPQVPVVVVSADERPETVLAAIDAGAAGFIPKTAKIDVLEQALRDLVEGRVALPRHTLVAATAASAGEPEPEFSTRQRDVLRLLIEGRSNKLICRELDLSESTVKTHLAAIFRKLGVETRTQAVLAVARLGLRLND